LAEAGAERLVLAVEGDAQKAVKLLEGDVGPGGTGQGFYPDDVAFYLGRGLEVLLSDFLNRGVSG